ncbi:uncharacterized protein LOC132910841 isoform X2 [Bombus pascuorum]|nr:uncharacterized protein LOC132910841 isoform X2 [Bombus pascuorum]
MCLCITETEQFIETIRKYPCVWDKEATVYNDNELKGKAWEQIAAKHGLQNGNVAKKEWKKLRDRLRDAMKRQKRITGQQQTNVKPWKYQKQMEFVIPQMRNRKRGCNLISPQQSEHSDEEECINRTAERTYSIQGEAIEQDPKERKEESKKSMKKHEQKQCRISENESNSIINFFEQQPETSENRRLIEQNDDPLLEFFQS